MVDQLKRDAFWEPEVILFLLAVEFQHLHPNLIDAASQFPQVNRVAQLYTELDGDRIVLKHSIQNPKSYEAFIQKLKDYGMGPNGHLANKAHFSIALHSPEAKSAWAEYTMVYGKDGLDLDALAKKISRYYETLKYKSKFAKFIRETLPSL